MLHISSRRSCFFCSLAGVLACCRINKFCLCREFEQRVLLVDFICCQVIFNIEMLRLKHFSFFLPLSLSVCVPVAGASSFESLIIIYSSGSIHNVYIIIENKLCGWYGNCFACFFEIILIQSANFSMTNSPEMNSNHLYTTSTYIGQKLASFVFDCRLIHVHTHTHSLTKAHSQ